jgi:hypothetical protein
MIASFLVAFALGFLGSAHCVGMCGPLVLSLPVQGLSAYRRGLSVGMYHAGRIGVYTMGGILFGLMGRRFYLAGWQQALSVLLGGALLFAVVLRALRGKGRLPGWALGYYNWLQGWMGRLWAAPSCSKFVLMGMANGMLPCGMVYFAIAGALTSSTLLQAAGFMAFFGLGTSPMLLGLQMTGRMVGVSFRLAIRKILPYLTAFMAILLILRGLNLGIPIISPVLAARPAHAVGCH